MHLRKRSYLLHFLLSSFILLQSFSASAQTQKTKSKVIFSYVSYEYGQPLQANPDDFAINSIYEVYDSKEIKIFSKRYDGTEIAANLKIDDNLYQEILKLKNLQFLRVAEKLKDGSHYAGAYDFIEVKHGKTSEQLCFIIPLVSDDLAKVIKSLHEINIDEEQKKKVMNMSATLNAYKNKILPVHKVSKLPLIELPPPPMN